MSWPAIALAVIVPGILWAQETGKRNQNVHPPTGYTGHWVAWYPNGQKKCESRYVDGKPDGKWIHWYASGVKTTEIDYAKGKRHGKHTTWHPSGKKASEAHFVNDEIKGSWTYWDDNGELRQGALVQLYEDGTKRSEEHYRNGKRDGTFSYWHANGRKQREENYRNGTLQGVAKAWYRNGQMLSLMEWKDARKHGKHVCWYRNGWKQDERVFEEGQCVKEIPVTGTLSPKQWGIRKAEEDIRNGKKRIYYFGKPYGGPQPPVDERSGLPIEIVAGCCVSREFAERVEAYNETMRRLGR